MLCMRMHTFLAMSVTVTAFPHESWSPPRELRTMAATTLQTAKKHDEHAIR